MIDINFIRNNVDLVKEAIKNKHMNVDIDRLLILDKDIRAIMVITEELRKNRNDLSKSMGQAKTQCERDEIIKKVQVLKIELAQKEEKQGILKAELDSIMLSVPSIPETDVPIGKTEDDNKELRIVGTKPNFDFIPKDHLEIMKDLDWLETERAAKYAGSRSYMLKGQAMLLEMALCRYSIDFLNKRGYVPHSVPVMVKEPAMQGTGYFPIGRDQAYYIEADGLYLVGTSEVSLAAAYMGEMLDLSNPIKMAGHSTCFRREAGAAGKDTRGLYRVHQFQKVEQLVICKEEDADKLQLEILKNVEDMLIELGLSFRVALACTGELGIGQTRKYEVETWMPSRNAYCETHSCSKMGTFQARRLNIKYKENGIIKYAVTLNNTAIATPRFLIPLIECYQKQDGTVEIPKVLKKYI
ncbi:MAG: serine--tRNA ligase [Firmicutes bacterium]|nr:serine--tRNA ligase [Bacillota bacterium]